MSQIVAQSDGLREIRIQTQGCGDGAGNLGHFQRMCQARAKVISLVGDEHLGLFLQPPESRRVDDAVAVRGQNGVRVRLSASG